LYMERNYARIKYVTYNPKTKSGIIELVDPHAEQVVKAMIEDGVFFDNVTPKFRVLEAIFIRETPIKKQGIWQDISQGINE
ncbi:18204_t:CDS:2, partial [Entrophospora sp. SA101]